MCLQDGRMLIVVASDSIAKRLANWRIPKMGSPNYRTIKSSSSFGATID